MNAIKNSSENFSIIKIIQTFKNLWEAFVFLSTYIKNLFKNFSGFSDLQNPSTTPGKRFPIFAYQISSKNSL